MTEHVRREGDAPLVRAGQGREDEEIVAACWLAFAPLFFALAVIVFCYTIGGVR